MSKNMTRKGLAFGAGFALVATGLAAMPAQADTTGPVTLEPTEGTTFNSILQSGITLQSEIDDDISANEAGTLAFLVENPDGRNVTLDFDNQTGTYGEFLGLAQDDSFAVTPATNMDDSARLDGNNSNEDTSLSFTDDFALVTGSSNAGTQDGSFAEILAGLREVTNFNGVSFTQDKIYELKVAGEAPVVIEDATNISDLVSKLDDRVSGYTVTGLVNTITVSSISTGNVTNATLKSAKRGEIEIDISSLTHNGTADHQIVYGGETLDTLRGASEEELRRAVRNVAPLIGATASGAADTITFLFDEVGTTSTLAVNEDTDGGDDFDDITPESTATIVGSAYANEGTATTVDGESDRDDHVNFGTTSDATELSITTGETSKTVTLHVTAFLDEDGDGVVDTFEKSSDRETVVLYPASAVTATTKITTAERDDDLIKAEVEYGLDINPYMVSAATKVVFYRDGSTFEVDDTNTVDDADGSGDTTFDDASSTERTAENDYLVDTDTVSSTDDRIVSVDAFQHVNQTENTDESQAPTNYDLPAGNYTARAVYTATSPDVYIGGPSAVADLRDGGNSAVTGVEVSLTESDNLDYLATDNDGEVELRTGTKSFEINTQIIDGSGDLEAAGVRVRAIVTGDVVDEDSEITLSGATGMIDEKDDVLTGYAFTDSDGTASFTVTSNNGAKDDDLTITIAVLKSNGVYEAATAGNGSDNDLDVTWADATLTDFDAKGGTFASGDPVTVTFEAEDQFGAGMDSNDDGSFSIYAEAVLGGVATPSTFSETTATSDGAVTFTFDNYATVATPQQLKATLYAGTTDYTSTPVAPVFVNVYNTLATDEIVVSDAFQLEVSYTDFVVGADDSEAVVDSKIASDTTEVAITGTVLNANNQPQPGLPVTISGDGLFFYDGDDYTLDTVTVNANEFGFFTVDVWTHSLNVTGQTVTIEAGGLTTTTLLKSYLTSGITDDDLSFSWDFPSQLVMNTTYAITATLTDKWGNPIAAEDGSGTITSPNNDYAIEFQGTGSIEVNGVGTGVQKNFGSNGTVTVFVRSIKDIAGPGSVTATLGTTWRYLSGVDATTKPTVGTIASSNPTDIASTEWDETTWASTLSVEVDVLETAPAAEQKVNAGSFKGFVAVYALGYEGQRLSAKIGNDWVIVDPIVNNESDNLFRVTDFTGAGVDIAVRIYIDRVLIDTINLTTK